MVKAFVGGVQKFSTGDGPGIRTTVFLTGCPLRCQWCHNPELIKGDVRLMYSRNRCIGCRACVDNCPGGAITFDGQGAFCYDRSRCKKCFQCVEHCYAQALTCSAKEMSIEEILALAAQDKGYYDATGGGLTISGGECLASGDFTAALARAAKDRGIGVAIETSGMGDIATLRDLCETADYILYDMKAIDDRVHREYVGASNKVILDNLGKIAGNPLWNPKIQIRMPLMHGINDTDEIIEKTIRFMQDHKLTKAALIPYHEMGISKSVRLGESFTKFETPSDQRLYEIWKRFDSAGICAEISGRDLNKLKQPQIKEEEYER